MTNGNSNNTNQALSIFSDGVLLNDGNQSFMQQDPATVPATTTAKVLSSKLNQLSMEERTLGIHELHGVADDGSSSLNSSSSSHSKMEFEEMQQERLLEMTATINVLAATQDTSAYEKALEQSPSYVSKMKRLCLQADYENAAKAAHRLLAFFAFKENLFGTSKLVQDITMEDFQGQDREGLNSGMFQVLAEKDRAGRIIIMFVGRIASEYKLDTVLRVLYYTHMMALEDKETPVKGIVTIFYTLGQTKFYSDRPSQHAKSLLSIPLRIAAMHVCYDKKLMDLAVKMFCHSIESRHACRFRGHYGSYLECVYNLMTFGIPKHVLPIDLAHGGEMNLQSHKHWVAMMQYREHNHKLGIQKLQAPMDATATNTSSSNQEPFRLEIQHVKNNDTQQDDDLELLLVSADPCRSVTPDGGSSSTNNNGSTNEETIPTNPCDPSDDSQNDYNDDLLQLQFHEIIMVPSQMDIIVGRGNLSRSSAGYLRMRNLVEDCYEEYENAPRSKKTDIAKRIVGQAHLAGCRFIRWESNATQQQQQEDDSGHFVICEEAQAREKVAHTFRNMRRTMSKKGKTDNSTTGSRGVKRGLVDVV